MATLGQRLAQNIAQEEQAKQDAQAARLKEEAEVARREFEVAKRFFDEARRYFTDSIMAGATLDTLYRQVGGPRYRGTSAIETHADFNEVLQGYQYLNGIPCTLTNPLKFGTLWKDFERWAQSEGLRAQWDFCHDGAGMDSWWRLVVKVN